ncbi:MAG: radical SAM protein [Candidatus Omnitrophica bacterium]|nr:radical SAM protein [Candidatus Omnitrophota bacterium]MBU4479267.1 radical SAM protein [Candidatus Omnitrophota bacterium]
MSLSDSAFREKKERADLLSLHCSLCPRRCGAGRLHGQAGACGAGKEPEVAHFQAHFGEEPPLSGKHGAGTIFFPHCSLHCAYCQNHQISRQSGVRYPLSAEQLGLIMVRLQEQGVHNIDLVSPTHFVPGIIAAVHAARDKGLRVPIVYNTNGYETADTLELLSGIVDVYLPDFKYADERTGLRYSGVADYAAYAKEAIEAMYKQAGDLLLDENGFAQKGLLVRHLVLPGYTQESMNIIDFLKERLGTAIGLSVMSQYAPCYRAHEFAELNRKLCVAEYDEVVEHVQEAGFTQCWIQELESNAVYFPDFGCSAVFGNDLSR